MDTSVSNPTTSCTNPEQPVLVDVAPPLRNPHDETPHYQRSAPPSGGGSYASYSSRDDDDTDWQSIFHQLAGELDNVRWKRQGRTFAAACVLADHSTNRSASPKMHLTWNGRGILTNCYACGDGNGKEIWNELVRPLRDRQRQYRRGNSASAPPADRAWRQSDRQRVGELKRSGNGASGSASAPYNIQPRYGAPPGPHIADTCWPALYDGRTPYKKLLAQLTARQRFSVCTPYRMPDGTDRSHVRDYPPANPKRKTRWGGLSNRSVTGMQPRLWTDRGMAWPVLAVEGEQDGAAAVMAMGQYMDICSVPGESIISSDATDWSPLAGRTVIFMPDADLPKKDKRTGLLRAPVGPAAVAKAAPRLQALGCQVFVTDYEDTIRIAAEQGLDPDGVNCSDLTPDNIRLLVSRALPAAVGYQLLRQPDWVELPPDTSHVLLVHGNSTADPMHQKDMGTVPPVPAPYFPAEPHDQDGRRIVNPLPWQDCHLCRIGRFLVHGVSVKGSDISLPLSCHKYSICDACSQRRRDEEYHLFEAGVRELKAQYLVAAVAWRSDHAAGRRLLNLERRAMAGASSRLGLRGHARWHVIDDARAEKHLPWQDADSCAATGGTVRILQLTPVPGDEDADAALSRQQKRWQARGDDPAQVWLVPSRLLTPSRLGRLPKPEVRNALDGPAIADVSPRVCPPAFADLLPGRLRWQGWQDEDETALPDTDAMGFTAWPAVVSRKPKDYRYAVRSTERLPADTAPDAAIRQPMYCPWVKADLRNPRLKEPERAFGYIYGWMVQPGQAPVMPDAAEWRRRLAAARRLDDQAQERWQDRQRQAADGRARRQRLSDRLALELKASRTYIAERRDRLIAEQHAAIRAEANACRQQIADGPVMTAAETKRWRQQIAQARDRQIADAEAQLREQAWELRRQVSERVDQAVASVLAPPSTGTKPRRHNVAALVPELLAHMKEHGYRGPDGLVSDALLIRADRYVPALLWISGQDPSLLGDAFWHMPAPATELPSEGEFLDAPPSAEAEAESPPAEAWQAQPASQQSGRTDGWQRDAEHVPAVADDVADAEPEWHQVICMRSGTNAFGYSNPHRCRNCDPSLAHLPVWTL